MGTNDKTNWLKRVAGEIIPVHDNGEPDYGVYKIWQERLKTWWPIRYGYRTSDGALLCRYNNKLIDEQRACELA